MSITSRRKTFREPAARNPASLYLTSRRMESKMQRLIARALWIVPALLFLLVPHQAKVAYDLRQTLERGVRATAQITEVHQENRVDVTYDWVSLRVRLPDGRTIEKERMSLPHTLITPLEDKETVEVRVVPGADQEVVITEIASTQWRIAALNAAMSGGAALIFALCIFAWGRYLRREGDPAAQGIERDDAEHPAGRMQRR